MWIHLWGQVRAGFFARDVGFLGQHVEDDVGASLFFLDALFEADLLDEMVAHAHVVVDDSV